MDRYRDDSTGMDFDSRQDEDESPCAECGVWQLDELMEPCPPGVIGRSGAVCGGCAEMLRGEVERMAAE